MYSHTSRSPLVFIERWGGMLRPVLLSSHRKRRRWGFQERSWLCAPPLPPHSHLPFHQVLVSVTRRPLNTIWPLHRKLPGGNLLRRWKLMHQDNVDSVHLDLLRQVLRREDTSRTEPLSLDVLGEVCSGNDVFRKVVECPTH
jgi:hypothetical protein